MTSSLEARLTTTLANIATNTLPEQTIHSLIDLTLLNEDAPTSAIDNLVATAIQQQVAAICVFSKHLSHIPNISPIQRATVANFPSGNESIETALATIDTAITQHHADEIDYVFPYALYLTSQKKQALALYNEANQLCKRHQRHLKVIIETGALSSLDVIYRLSRALIDQGCDMIKTSTGKIATGATIPAVFAILSAIQDSQSTCGIKISGGVKTPMQAQQFIHLAEHMLQRKADKQWFRVGTSGFSS